MTDVATPSWSAPELNASASPQIVFASLAATSVAGFSDACRITLTEDDGTAYQLDGHTSKHQRGEPGPHTVLADSSEAAGITRPARSVRTVVAGTPMAGAPGYHGAVVHSWNSDGRGARGDVELAALMVGRAVDLVHQQRLTERVARLEHQVERLQRAVMNNRKIGLALGVLAASRQISYLQAHELLRAASRGSGRTIRAVADEVAFRGTLAWPPAEATQRRPVCAVRDRRRRDGRRSA